MMLMSYIKTNLHSWGSQTPHFVCPRNRKFAVTNRTPWEHPYWDIRYKFKVKSCYKIRNSKPKPTLSDSILKYLYGWEAQNKSNPLEEKRIEAEHKGDIYQEISMPFSRERAEDMPAIIFFQAITDFEESVIQLMSKKDYIIPVAMSWDKMVELLDNDYKDKKDDQDE